MPVDQGPGSAGSAAPDASAPSGGGAPPGGGPSRRTVLLAVLTVAALLAGSLVVVRMVTRADSSGAATEPSASAASPTGQPTEPTLSPPTTRPDPHGSDTITVYAHPPVDYRGTTPTEYVQALRDRAAWADGLFLYYPAHLDFGARPEIDALQEAFPDGIPLTVSAKRADPEGLQAFRDQLTPQQAKLTLWERWQEPADDFTTAARRAAFRADVVADIEILRPAGIRVGVHEQCWTLDPANHQGWAGEESLVELIPPEVDIVTATCLGFSADDSGPAQMTRVIDFMAEHYPGVELGFTSLSWSVPAGTPADSPLRGDRAQAAQEAIDFAIAAGVTEFGWFDFADWEGRDSDVRSDPALRRLLVELSSRPLPE